MAEVIRMPKMSDTMEKGVIATWLKKVGDLVQAGDTLAEVETDKATMELEAYEEGTLLHIGVQENEAVAINGVIAIIGDPNEDISILVEEIKRSNGATIASSSKNPDATLVNTPPQPAHAIDTTQLITNKNESARIFASPLAKKMAQMQGYDLSQIQGTGERGRIIKRDIEDLLISQSSNKSLSKRDFSEVSSQGGYEDKPVSQMRKAIARRLSESKLTAPEFELTMRIDMDQVVAARPQINEYAPVKITFNDIVIKAVAMAIKKHPLVNTAWLGEQIRYYQQIHIGVATAVETGLLVPVIRFADQLSLAQIANQVKDLSEKARKNQLQPADWEGSTFTISNLGMHTSCRRYSATSYSQTKYCGPWLCDESYFDMRSPGCRWSSRGCFLKNFERIVRRSIKIASLKVNKLNNLDRISTEKT
jgi:pyruvate dehydrogenase E2 component (dihydrolipoamide acetyltransferase)